MPDDGYVYVYHSENIKFFFRFFFQIKIISVLQMLYDEMKLFFYSKESAKEALNFTSQLITRIINFHANQLVHRLNWLEYTKSINRTGRNSDVSLVMWWYNTKRLFWMDIYSRESLGIYKKKSCVLCLDRSNSWKQFRNVFMFQ